jgi:Ca2+/H+ antiporter
MLPVYLYPLGGVYMIYIWMKEKKKNMPRTIIGNILGNIGWIVGMNLLIMGFFFSDQLGEALGIARDYHGFSMMLGAVIGLIIPGILLNMTRRKENV